MPVADAGGWRVDTGSADEAARWFFASLDPAVPALARRVAAPGHILKVCCAAEELRRALPPAWHIEATGHVTVSGLDWSPRPLPSGYEQCVVRGGDARHVSISDRYGATAASGYAGETATALVFDRIVTSPDHRRRGLGRAVMSALLATRINTAAKGLLVATDVGRRLYETLGWQTLSPYATASIVA